MVGGPLLPVHGTRDIHTAGHGVDAEHLHGGLVGTHARDAVANRDVIVLIGADLEGRGVAAASACCWGLYLPHPQVPWIWPCWRSLEDLGYTEN